MRQDQHEMYAYEHSANDMPQGVDWSVLESNK